MALRVLGLAKTPLGISGEGLSVPIQKAGWRLIELKLCLSAHPSLYRTPNPSRYVPTGGQGNMAMVSDVVNSVSNPPHSSGKGYILTP